MYHSAYLHTCSCLISTQTTTSLHYTFKGNKYSIISEVGNNEINFVARTRASLEYNVYMEKLQYLAMTAFGCLYHPTTPKSILYSAKRNLTHETDFLAKKKQKIGAGQRKQEIEVVSEKYYDHTHAHGLSCFYACNLDE